jgi:hypothetical protein
MSVLAIASEPRRTQLVTSNRALRQETDTGPNYRQPFSGNIVEQTSRSFSSGGKVLDPEAAEDRQSASSRNQDRSTAHYFIELKMRSTASWILETLIGG